MKLIILFILLIPLVSAIYGGETEIIHHFDKCSSLNVIVSGTLEINKTEYNFLNCSEILENEWECNCYDGFDLIITTKVNTLNNYLIDILYSYEEITTTTSVSYSSGGTNWECDDWSECKERNKTKFCYKEFNKGINYTNTKECDIEIIKEPKEPKEPENKTIILEPETNETIILEPEEPEEKEEKSYKLLIIISIVLLIIITFVIIMVIIIRRYKNE